MSIRTASGKPRREKKNVRSYRTRSLRRSPEFFRARRLHNRGRCDSNCSFCLEGGVLAKKAALLRSVRIADGAHGSRSMNYKSVLALTALIAGLGFGGRAR